jgi:hypothetical protein
MHRRPLFLLAFAGLAIAAEPAFADPPPWAPAHGRRAKEEREYRYVYYPAQQVYYAPAQQTWFWMNGGNWQFGLNLPNQFHVAANAGVPVMLQSPQPYVQHVYVEERYGRPWREKHNEKHHHKEKHEKKHHRDHDGHDRHDD